jgi:hypothetical protein
MIVSGAIAHSIADIFKTQVSARLARFMSVSPSTVVILVPSIRDIVSHHIALPQAAFEKESFGLPRVSATWDSRGSKLTMVAESQAPSQSLHLLDQRAPYFHYHRRYLVPPPPRRGHPARRGGSSQSPWLTNRTTERRYGRISPARAGPAELLPAVPGSRSSGGRGESGCNASEAVEIEWSIARSAHPP